MLTKPKWLTFKVAFWLIFAIVLFSRLTYTSIYPYYDKMLELGYTWDSWGEYHKQYGPHKVHLEFVPISTKQDLNSRDSIIINIETQYSGRSTRPLFCDERQYKKRGGLGFYAVFETTNGYLVPHCLVESRLKKVLALPQKDFSMKLYTAFASFIPYKLVGEEFLRTSAVIKTDDIPTLEQDMKSFINYLNAMMDIS